MLTQLLQTNLELILEVIVGIQTLLLILVVLAFVRVGRITGRFKILLQGTGKANLEETLLQGIALGRENKAVLSRLEVRQTELMTTLTKCVQNLGVVRYNAFEDLGSELSFSVALLDSNGDGVVVSSIYGRDDSRTYAKPIVQGNSKYPLSTEESQAIREAMQIRARKG